MNLDIFALFPTCSRQSQNSSPGAKSQRTDVAHSMYNSASYTQRVPHSWKSSTVRLRLPRQRLGSRSSNGASLFGKNNNPNCRTTGTFLLRNQSYSQTVRISLQRLMFRTTPSARIPGPAKLEPLLGSYLSPSGLELVAARW